MKKVTNVWSEPVPVPFLQGRSKGYHQLIPGGSLDIDETALPKDLLRELERLEKKSRITIASIEESVKVVKNEILTPEEVVEDTPLESEDIEKLEQELLAEGPEDLDE